MRVFSFFFGAALDFIDFKQTDSGSAGSLCHYHNSLSFGIAKDRAWTRLSLNGNGICPCDAG